MRRRWVLLRNLSSSSSRNGLLTPTSIVELLHQRVIQEADMTCAMDWHHPGGEDHPPLFYDVWISRK